MPAKKKSKSTNTPLTGAALIKEVCRRIRLARSYWDAHNNAACRGERAKAIDLYETLSSAEREKVPEQLRIWLRYRSEKYFGGRRGGSSSNATDIRASGRAGAPPGGPAGSR